MSRNLLGRKGTKRPEYMDVVRFATHWHQFQEVLRTTPANGKVLEVGPGNGHVTWLLRMVGFDVTTADYDPDRDPDVVADITDLNQFDNFQFDTVLAAEVLEHIPFCEVPKAISELSRVARSLVISVPAPFVGVAIALNVPKLNPIRFHVGFPLLKTHRYDGMHYWELGKRPTGVNRFLALFRDSGLTIARHYRPLLSLYCYFVVVDRAIKELQS